jgi:tetratricopeptide (TPR) repeat protein
MLDRLIDPADAPTPSAVITRACLGAAHRGQGRLLLASAAYQQALDLAFRTQGIDAALLSTLEANVETVRYELGTPRHDARSETALDDANLAVALRNEGRLEEAESTARVALEHGLTAKTPDIPALQTNLAAIRRERGDPAAAEELLVKAENTARRALGRRHPETLTIRASLAAVRHDLGRHTEAAALLEKVIADRARTLGRAHPATLQARTSLGFIRLATDDDAAADREFGTVLADGRKARDANVTPVLERATQGQALVSERRRETA